LFSVVLRCFIGLLVWRHNSLVCGAQKSWRALTLHPTLIQLESAPVIEAEPRIFAILINIPPG
jgi:hypothetical protein